MTQPTQLIGESCNTIKDSHRSRNWCFTLNNYSEESIKLFRTIEKCKYLFQEEKGESGTPHLQGILIFENTRTFRSMKKLHPGCHWEIARSKLASIRYCCKPETRNGAVFANFKYEDYIKEEIDLRLNLVEEIIETDEEFGQRFAEIERRAFGHYMI